MKAFIISSVIVVVLLTLFHNNADAQSRYHRHYGRPGRAYVRYCPPPRPVRVYTQPVICYNPPPPCPPRYNRHYRNYDRGYYNNNRNNGYHNNGYRKNYHRRY